MNEDSIRAASVIGTPELSVVTHGLDILMLRSPSAAPSFGAIMLSSHSKELEAERTLLDDGNAVERTVTQAGAPVIRTIDFCVPENRCFIRRFVSARRFVFRPVIPPYVVRYPVDTLRSNSVLCRLYRFMIPHDARIEGCAPLGRDIFMFMVLAGDITADSESGRIIIQHGTGFVLAGFGDDPNALLRSITSAMSVIKKRYSPVSFSFAPEKCRNTGISACPEALKEPISSLLSHRCETGFVLSDMRNPIADPITQYLSVRAFLCAGLPDRALDILDAYNRSFERRGGVIWGEEGGARCLQSACEGSVTPALVVLSALEFPLGRLPERFIPMLTHCIRVQIRSLSLSMMPFNGNENHPVARALTYQGSALATMLFIESGRRYMERFMNNRALIPDGVGEAVNEATAAFPEHFMKRGTPVANAPEREGSFRRPMYKYGYCPCCSAKEAAPLPCWLERVSGGSYLCADCASRDLRTKTPGFDPAERQVNYANLLYAAYLRSTLFPSGLIKQITASMLTDPEALVAMPFQYGLLAWTASSYKMDGKYITRAYELLDSRFALRESRSGTRSHQASSGLPANITLPDSADNAAAAAALSLRV